MMETGWRVAKFYDLLAQVSSYVQPTIGYSAAVGVI
jgi:hypothetical protein